MLAADPLDVSATPVVFSFVAEDDHHNRLPDLTQDEFKLLDDAQEQKAVALTIASPSSTRHRELSILVDSSSADSVRLASEFLSNADLSNLAVSVWDATQLQLLQPFTTERAALTQAVARIANGTTNPTAAIAKELPAISGDPVVRDANDHAQDEQFRPWMAILFALAKAEGPASGRKEVLFFVSNEDQTSATASQLSALVSNAAHAELSVYIVESRPMTVRAETQAAKMVAGKTKRASQNGPATEPRADSALQNVLREVAIRTGGLYALARTAPAVEVLRSVVADLAASYEVRYDPRIASFDGHIRKLDFKTSRGHIKLRAPAAYIAAPRASFVDLTPSEPALYAYLQAGKPDTAFPLDCEAMQFGRDNGKARAEVVIQLPLRAMQAEEDEAGSVSSRRFSILVLVKTQDGQVVRKLGRDVLYQQQKTPAKNRPDVYTFARQVLLEPGQYVVQVVARDENSARTATKDIPLTLTVASSGIEVADIVLVRGAEKDAAEPDNDPLNYGTVRIVPFISQSVNLQTGSELPVILTVYPNASGPPPAVELELHRDQELLASFPLLGSMDALGQYKALVMLQPASLVPGHYTFIARATDNDKVFEQRREFDLTAAEPAGTNVADDSAPEPVKPVFALEDNANVVAGQADETELTAVLEGARTRSAEYKRNLPNFSCVETTQQYSARTSRAPAWKVKNTFSELLRYSSGAENYRTIEINGERKSIDRSGLPGVRIDGEFGELLAGIYSPRSAATFRLKGKARVDGAEVFVVDYSVERPNSFYMLATADGNSRVQCAFRGTLYIDARDYSTRYVAIEAQDLPVNAQYRESTLSVRYDYVSFDGERFLLPKKASISVRVGKSKLMKDDIQFRDYHRYHATTRMIFQ